MIPDRWITDWECSERLPFYTRANVGEVLPEPASPLGWTLVFEQGLLKGWRRGFIDYGVYRSEELPEHRPPVVGSFGGYFYLNLTHMRLFGIRLGMTPDTLDAALLGSHPDTPPHRDDPRDGCPDCTERLRASTAWAMSTADFPEIDADRDRALGYRRDRPSLGTLDDAALVERMRSFLPELDNAFYRHDFSSLSSTVSPAVLGQLLEQIGRPELLLDLISGLGEVDSAAPSVALWDLSREITSSAELSALLDRGHAGFLAGMPAGFAARFTDFLVGYGCRGPNEWDIHSRSWEAHPVQAVALLDRLRHADEEHSPHHRAATLRQRRAAATEAVRAALTGDDLATFEAAMRSAALFIPGRERTKTTAVTLINEVRMAALELGRRAVAAGRLEDPRDITMLLADELDAYVADPESFTAILRGRCAGYHDLWQLEPPFFVVDRAPALGTWRRRDDARPDRREPAAGDRLSGVAGGQGRHQGRVRVVRDLEEEVELEPGDVLVAPLSDAAWTPLFLVAGAAVIDVGGQNSHAVVVCRELGLPCVVSVTGGSELLRDGMLVTVDGTSGTVTVDAVAEQPVSLAPVTPGG